MSRSTPSPRAGRRPRCGSRRPTWCPTKANLRTGYNSFAELAEACEAFCEKVNGRVHRETNRVPAEALLVEQGRLHPIPAAPFTAALGETRSVNVDQTIRFGSVRYSTPPGLVGREVWVRADGDELVITANQNENGDRAWSRWPGTGCRRRGTRGSICPTTPTTPNSPTGHRKPPQPKGRSSEEKAFLALGPGAHSWLVEAAAVGAQRVRSKMTAALELAALVGAEPVDAALGVAAAAGRFAEGDLLAIVHHRANGASVAVPGGRRRGPLRPTRHQRLGQLRHPHRHRHRRRDQGGVLMTTTTTTDRQTSRAGHHQHGTRSCPRSCSRCSSGCGCPICATPHPRCWPPPGRNAGTPPRSCAS